MYYYGGYPGYGGGCGCPTPCGGFGGSPGFGSGAAIILVLLYY